MGSKKKNKKKLKKKKTEQEMTWRDRLDDYFKGAASIYWYDGHDSADYKEAVALVKRRLADRNPMKSDWDKVGGDMYRAILKVMR